MRFHLRAAQNVIPDLQTSKDNTSLIQFISRLFLSSVVLLSASSYIAAQDTTSNDNHQPIVIVVTIDGFPARALEDPRLPMPTLRSLAAAGAVSTGMQPINPTVTWPNHTAMITGVDASHHFVMANGLVVLPEDGGAPQIEPWTDKAKLVHARTLYEAAAEKGLTTGQVDWVAIYGAKGVRWQFGEKPDMKDEIPQELIAQGIVTREQLEHFGDKSTPAWRDEIWTDAAVDIIERHSPNLLLFHLLQTDSIQHQYGPLTSAAYAAYASADQCLRRIVEAARTAGNLDRTTFFILSDHGFATYTHTISPNVALVEQGLLKKQDGRYKGEVWIKAEGGAASLYIRDPHRRAELLPKLKGCFSGVEGVAHVYTNDEARKLGIPAEADTDQAPLLYLTAAPDYAFGDDTSGALIRTNPVRGQHGYVNTMPEMQALFVASGSAIRSGVQLGPVSNLQVAPTIAKILGVQLPDAKQPPLSGILR
ncbi:putative AlkP superfamily pyrophosphatase or phosphodiesterase [Granulicella aggregans]|uniref:Putative AlkP superfamily pyrophosphatase or phosphodiesterase n=1 Tax=Granulicella aggregans TaxID=474949 RepID=A0A7W7ZG51_9BACT|nr:ectonucleotide pyrophosphatase/phosphodiesterase [Granulicella aggregans]MBB5059319.1 putative AlkP superfamily pyrophosphatase or phosphodiesterase [Granulicella aggregans]